MKNYFLILLLALQVLFVHAQKSFDLQIPTDKGWNEFKEGQTKKIQMQVVPFDTTRTFQFQITQGKQLGMSLDSSGVFQWNPDFTYVDRVVKNKLFQIYIEAKSDSGDYVQKALDIIVSHVNRPPVINDLKAFYVQFNTKNTYQIDLNAIYDEDEDPVVFVPDLETLPEGLSLSSRGEIVWTPSNTQFKSLQEKPMTITFTVEDQPSKLQSKGQLKLMPTQLDLPPNIILVPKNDEIVIKENETVNIGFYLSDPNGDDDIDVFDLLSNNSEIKKSFLTKNTNNQYEFTWTPSYDFVQDPLDSVIFHIDFFVIDKSQQRAVKRVNFRVNAGINEMEVDRKNYGLYKGTLTRAWELLEQLKEKEEELKKTYKKAKKGKKNRSVVNASLGATTGLSSIFTKNKEGLQRTISTVGGTTVLTISTLEATEVIGRSMKELLDRLNYVIEKKNELQTKGDIFARDYHLKSNRRNPNFNKSMDNLMESMNLKGLVALELDASWESKKTATDDNIRKSFKDFAGADD